MTTSTQVDQTSFLVIDDDAISRDLVRLTLGHLGYSQVQLANDGKSGLRLLDAQPRAPDFIICDVFMPGTDGIEFVTALVKSRYRGGVMLASGGDPLMMQIAYQMGAEGGLNMLGAFVKPLQQALLGNAIAAGR